MKKLMLVVLVVAMGVVMTGCGKSDRERYMEAMSQVLTDADEIAKETKRFDELSDEKKSEAADYAEYFAILKKTTNGLMSMRDMKKTVEETFDGMTAEQRKDFLKRFRAEMK